MNVPMELTTVMRMLTAQTQTVATHVPVNLDTVEMEELAQVPCMHSNSYMHSQV